MPRNQGSVVESNFAAGYITEATSLNFPPNSWKESDNCTPEQIGNVTRRLGIDFEANYSTKTRSREDRAVSTYLWKNVAGSSTLQLFVVQTGDRIHFWDASTTDPLSSHPITDFIDLDDFKYSGAPTTRYNECQYADGNGLLFVTHPQCDPFRVSYDENTETFTANRIVVRIRDLKGLDDNLEVDERPTSGYSGLSTEKKYNLRNQGWNQENLDLWDAARTDMPSNADVMWSFKDSNEDFDTDLIEKFYRGNSPAPKGRYILKLFDQDRGDASGLTIPSEVLPARFRTVAFHAGRVFYAGIDYEGYNSKIYFSQVVENPDQYSKAYQINDPTSEIMFDLLPTDGGFIDIRECGNIIKIAPLGSGLAVWASNGVWFVSGSTGLGFTATDYSVVKISETHALTASSFVEVGGTMSWWNLEGIQTLQLEGAGGKVVSLTEPKIKTYYNTIPPSAKRAARGFFNGITGIVQWIYREDEAEDVTQLYEATKLLNFNTNTGAFYIWTPAVSDVTINGIVVLEHRGGDVEEELVTVDGVTVTADGDDVTVLTLENAVVVPKFKYLVSYPDDGSYELTFAEAWDEDYEDWASFDDAVDYESYFITGYGLRGEGNKTFQNNYVTFHSGMDSQYYVQGIWDFTNSGDSGRWTSTQLIDTTTQTHRDYVYNKRKIRGHGKAVQIKVSSVPGQSFNVIGWAVNVAVNTVV